MSRTSEKITFGRRDFLRAGLAAAVLGCSSRLLAAVATELPRQLIDVHHHCLPEVYLRKAESILRREFGRRWPPPAWDTRKALAAMDKHAIATAILSIGGPGVWVGTAEKSRELARDCNEVAAGVVADHPSRFGYFASLPLPDIDGALAEIDYAEDTLKADGFIVYSSHQSAWLGDQQFWPVYEAFDTRRAVVLVHPLPPDRFRDLQTDVPFTTLEYPFDTARAIVNWMVSGAAKAFPNIRLIFPHGGGPTAMLIDRIRALPRVNPKLVERLPDGGIDGALQSLFYDTAAIANPAGISALRSMVPASQILFGTDAPIQIPSRIIAELDSQLGQSADRDRIYCGNALRLFPRLAKQPITTGMQAVEKADVRI